MAHFQLHCADCLDHMRSLPSTSIDLVFTSPPYEAARTYGIDFSLRGQDWVDWCMPRFLECLRVCRGLVAWVVQGQTRKYQWSAAPALLVADLHRAGVNLRNPAIYKRYGIPGSGGRDWLRSDYEWIICAAPPGRLPWSDNTVMGHAPKWQPGGKPSHRTRSGRRCNRPVVNTIRSRPSHYTADKIHSYTRRDDRLEYQGYKQPIIANPGNVIDCGAVGGSHLGSWLAHDNEAPFPEKLAEFFVRSFCPPGGTTLDPFCGSGTALAVALSWSRHAVGIDIRQSQIDLSRKRCVGVTPIAMELAR